MVSNRHLSAMYRHSYVRFSIMYPGEYTVYIVGTFNPAQSAPPLDACSGVLNGSALEHRPARIGVFCYRQKPRTMVQQSSPYGPPCRGRHGQALTHLDSRTPWTGSSRVPSRRPEPPLSWTRSLCPQPEAPGKSPRAVRCGQC